MTAAERAALDELIEDFREALTALVGQWREIASRPNRPTGFVICADQLDALLARHVEESSAMDLCSCGHRREGHHIWGRCHGELCKCTRFVFSHAVGVSRDLGDRE